MIGNGMPIAHSSIERMGLLRQVVEEITHPEGTRFRVGS
jgi:hypothetical protein